MNHYEELAQQIELKMKQMMDRMDEFQQKLDQISVSKVWMNVQEVARYLSLSESKIRKMISHSEIPYRRIGDNGSLRFNSKMIDLWMLSNGCRQTYGKRDRQMLEILK